MDRIRMAILRDSQPVSTVVLGEELELRWIVRDSADRDTFLVEECVAERLDGPLPIPAPLTIILQGYTLIFTHLH